MDTSWWVVIVAVLVVGAIVVVLRSQRAQADQAQARRITVQKAGGAHSPAEEITQREDRRLGGMSGEDRAWETASLERHQDREARAQRDKTNDKSSGGIGAFFGTGGGGSPGAGKRAVNAVRIGGGPARRYGQRPWAILFAPGTYATLLPYLTYNRWTDPDDRITAMADGSLDPDTVVLAGIAGVKSTS